MSNYSNGLAFCNRCNDRDNNDLTITYNFNGTDLYIDFARGVFKRPVTNPETGLREEKEETMYYIQPGAMKKLTRN